MQRGLYSLAFASLAALGLPTVVAERCKAEVGGCASPLVQAELAQEETATDFRFELLQRDVKRGEAIKAAEKPGERAPTAKSPYRRAPLSLVSQSANASSHPQPGLQVPPPYDCEKFPFFCHPKVDCPAMSKDARYKQSVRISTDEGHSNFQSWCLAYPDYAESMPLCLFGNDKLEFARMMYQEQLALGATEIDAWYCFGSGHCDNDKVTLDTTVAEAEEICTEIYGEEWKNVGWDDFQSTLLRAGTTDAKKALSQSFHETLATTKRETAVLAMAACGQGNFACDVFYCKANYCENESYKKQYSWAAKPL